MPGSTTMLLTPEEVRAKGKEAELKKPETRVVVDKHLADLTPKQRKYAILCVTHPHLSENARRKMAGYTGGSHTPAGLQQIQGKLGKLLLDIGITERDIAKGIKDGLAANFTKVENVPIRDKDGKVTGHEFKTFEHPDHKTRQRYLDMLIRISGYQVEKTKKVDVTHHLGTSAPVPELRDRQRELAEKMKVNGSYTVEETAAI